MYPRHIHSLVRDMLGEFRIVCLTGPKQSGKTTLTRAVAAEAGMRYLTLDDPAVQAGSAFERGVLVYTGDRALPFHRGPSRMHAVPLGSLTAAAD